MTKVYEHIKFNIVPIKKKQLIDNRKINNMASAYIIYNNNI